MKPTTVVFDLGNVLIGWDPRVLYRKLFLNREADMEWFLTHVCNQAWNLEQDRGRSFASGTAELIAAHPETWHAMIAAYDERWHEMLTGEIPGSVSILERLHELGTPLYALTNWNQDKFAFARAGYPLLQRFRGIVVSGEERCVKPEPAIYHTLLTRLANVEGAHAVGMHALHFQNAEQLAPALRDLGFDI
jgi:2-haloacid dehalogenase